MVSADAVGVATFVAPSGHSVLDLVLVPADANADMSAVDIECVWAVHHRAVAITMYSCHSKSKCITVGSNECVQIVSY